ncbi:MAG: hypothetical protein JSS32_01140 [Verrucomicrobia bacterium]|nr:hypothetical protein [Verrucomicrobiota bacterium]
MIRILLVNLMFLFPYFCIANGQNHVISLGPNCIVAGFLQHNGFRFESLPLDWTITHNFDGLIRGFEEDFAHYLDPEYLIYHDWGVVHNTRYEIVMSHFFHTESAELREKITANTYLDYLAIPGEKVHRRLQRMLALLEGTDPVFFIRLGVVPVDRLIHFRDFLTSKYPTLNFQIVICDVMENPFPNLESIEYCRIVHAGDTWEEQIRHPQWGTLLRNLKLIP